VDWAAVTSIAITGAVGIAGVAGTIIAARIAGKSARESAQLSINAEADRARLADKRQVYAHATAALHAAMAAVVAANASKDHPPGDTSAPTDREVRTALFAALDAVSELRLIAPRPVGGLASQALSSINGYWEGRSDMGDEIQARSLLFDALHADLDEEAKRSG